MILPHVKITELLLEVDEWTGFTRHFTHLKSGDLAKDKNLLLTTILADAINLGLTKMAESCPGTTYAKLAWLQAWHIRDETYGAALAELVNAQFRHPFAEHWGDGTTSSSDGQNFRTGSKAESTGHINPKYGSSPGRTFYTHISDQYAPFHTKVVNVGVRDSTYVLDGLLYHESDLRIEEHYTDTAGFTDHVFALMHLLGFRFAPRIRDLGDTKLYIPKGDAAYDALKPMIGGTLNIKHVRAHWDEILRLATSIKQGTVTASLMLRKLGSYPRQNGLAVALRELGRIERTLFILDWLQSVELRRRVHAGLNKGEARNALARAVFFNRLGEIRDRSFEQQRYRASGLNLVTAAIVLWNTVYLERAANALRGHGQAVDDALLQYLSPLGWEHINLTGDYLWRSSAKIGAGKFRPLRALQRVGCHRCRDQRGHYRRQFRLHQFAQRVRLAGKTRYRAAHAAHYGRTGQRPLPALCVGESLRRPIEDRVALSADLLPEFEPHRAFVEVRQKAVPLRQVLPRLPFLHYRYRTLLARYPHHPRQRPTVLIDLELPNVPEDSVVTAHGIAYDFFRFLRRPLLAFKAVEYLVGRDPQRLVMHRFLPELAQVGNPLLVRAALVRPVA
jgi:TnpA family transposase